MKPKLLVVDNYDSFTYNLIQILTELGCRFSVVKNDAFRFDAIDRYDKILIAPGPGIPSESGKILELIKICSHSKSILCVCLGCQSIAEVFGGRLKLLHRPSHGVGKEITILRRDEYIYKGLPRKIKVGLYHSWAIDAGRIPPCLSVTAVDRNGTVMSVMHNDLDVRGVQFHPESIMTGYGVRMMSNWVRR